MSQMVRALPALLPDQIAPGERNRWIEAANDDVLRDLGNTRAASRFGVLEVAGETSNEPPKARSFRIRIDPGADHWRESPLSPRSTAKVSDVSGEAAPSAAWSSDALDGLAIGDPARNAPSFLASLIAQSRLGQGLAYSPHAMASEAYRAAGVMPPMPDGQMRLLAVLV